MRYLILVFAFSLCCYVEAGEFPQAKISGDPDSASEKIYPEPDQLLISAKKIRIQTPSKKGRISAQCVCVKDGRICAIVRKAKHICKRGPCRIHRIWHPACGGCGVLLCPGNCTCFD